MELLTKKAVCGYSWGTVVNPTVGIATPYETRGAQAPLLERFFCACFTFYGGLGGPLRRAVSFGTVVATCLVCHLKIATLFWQGYPYTKGNSAMQGHSIPTPNLDQIQRALSQAKSISLTLSMVRSEDVPDDSLCWVFSAIHDLLETIERNMEGTNDGR